MWPLPDEGFFPPFDDRGDDRDARLARQVRERLGAVGRIRVDVQNGVALLSGTAASTDERRSALWIARSVPGVRDVCNAVHVPDDADVADVTGSAGPDADRAFAEITAGLLVPPAPPTPRRRRASFVTWAAVVLLTFAWVSTSVVVLAVGGLGVAIACQILAVMVAIAAWPLRRRRHNRRTGTRE